MAIFNGLLDVDQWDGTNERPEDWLRVLFLIMPNGDAPLAALLGLMSSRRQEDIKFHWWEKGLHTNRILSDGGGSSSATSLTFTLLDDATDAGPLLRKNLILMHETSKELMLVTASSGSGAVTVQRSFGSVAAATITDDDGFTILTTAHETGSGVPRAVYEAPTEYRNNTQIFKETLEETRTALQTDIRPYGGGQYKELKRASLERFATHIERAMLYGDRIDPTVGPDGNLIYTTGGVTNSNFLPTANNVAVGGTLDKDTWDTHVSNMFLYGGEERLALCGSTFMQFVQQMTEGQLVRNEYIEQTYKMQVYTYVTVWGRIHFKVHPLMRQHAVWTKDALFLDFEGKQKRVMEPIKFHTNAQGRDEDLRRDYWMGELGAMWKLGRRNFYLSGVTGFAG